MHASVYLILRLAEQKAQGTRGMKLLVGGRWQVVVVGGWQ